MVRTRACVCIAAACYLTACANTGANFAPMVDLRDRSQAQYEADLGQCQEYAREQAGPGTMAVVGAVIFGLAGAVLATRGHKSDIADKLAIIGAAKGAADGAGSQQDVVRRCMAGRGYNVLN